MRLIFFGRSYKSNQYYFLYEADGVSTFVWENYCMYKVFACFMKPLRNNTVFRIVSVLKKQADTYTDIYFTL